MIKNAIVLVPFPFGDQSAAKIRPALCLTPVVGDYEEVVTISKSIIKRKLGEININTEMLVKRKLLDLFIS